MNIDYSLQGDSAIIHKWYRDGEKRRHEVIRDFEPYFFVHKDEPIPNDSRIVRVESQTPFISNHGEPLKKVVVKSPKHVGGYDGLKKEFSATWESDVYFRTRYWLDEVDIDNDKQFLDRQYRVCMYDIEVDHSLDAQNAPEEITCITAHDSFLDKYVTFALNPPTGRKLEPKRDDDWSVYVFDPDDYEGDKIFTPSEKAERDMVLKFQEFVKDTDPDIVSAWNGETYDDPYLFNRCRYLKIDYSEFSPINLVDLINDGKRVKVKGREFVDMIPAFRKVYFSELDSYSLNNVGSDLLGLEKIKFQGTGGQLWRDNPQKLIDYNKHDVAIMVEINERFDVWGMLKEVQSWVGINIGDILHNSRVTQAYFMRNMDAKLPPKGYDKDKKKFKGATVLEETPGKSRNVAVLDLKAQYPSSMISFNMSPEMKVEDGLSDQEIVDKFCHTREELERTTEEVLEDYGYDTVEELVEDNTITVGTGATFWYREMGTIPKVLIEMIQERDMHKELRDEAEPGTDVYRRHDRRQYALKFVINSVYGVMGFPKFPLYDRDVAASTTFVGRETIMWAVKKARDLGYRVVYGDTDSIMISMGEDVTEEEAIEKAKKLQDFINESYDEYAEKNGVDTSRFEGVDREHFFEIEFEKLYKTFFMTKAKKKYAGHIVWKEGKSVDKYDFAQFGKRSSAAKVSNDVVQEVLKMILDGASQDDVQKYVTEVCNKIKNGEYDLDYIGIPSRMKKEIDEYKTDRPILRAVAFTNEYLAEEFGKGDKPKYVYIKATPPGMPGTDVVAFSQSDIPDTFSIDYDTMIRKNIQQKLKRILTEMDWPWESMYRQSKSLLDY